MKTKKTIIYSLLLSLTITSSFVYAFGQGNGEGRMSQNRPEGIENMTQEEREAYRTQRQEERQGNGEGRMSQNRPEGIENMTQEEREAYRTQRQEERQGNGEGRMNQNQKKFNKTARKAKNYKGFQKQLIKKKNFKDDDEINNQEAVKYLQQRGILDGYADGSFKPQKSINRAESVKVLLEALGETPEEIDNISHEFKDVSQNAWFNGYINRAKRKGIIKGYSDGTFKPEKTVNQAELLKIAFESFGIDLTNYPITAVDSPEAWYAPYLQYAIDNNLVDDVNLEEGMTREGFSEVIYRLILQQDSLN